MLVFLLSGAIVLPSALLLLACRYELIDSYELCLRAHFFPLIFLAVFTNVGGGAAIAILYIFRKHLLIALPAIVLALNALTFWTNMFWLGKLIPSELHDPIFYAGNALYAVVALFAGIVWLICRFKSSGEGILND
jgi:hypothetical protein